MNLSGVKVASAAHLSQKNGKDFRNTSIILAQFEHFRFRSDVAPFNISEHSSIQEVSNFHHQHPSTRRICLSRPSLALLRTSIRPNNFATSTLPTEEKCHHFVTEVLRIDGQAGTRCLRAEAHPGIGAVASVGTSK